MRKILGSLRKACEDYNMIQDGDKIAVGFSGGKDSVALIYALNLYKRFSKQKFELEVVSVDPGFSNMDFTKAKEFVKGLGLKYTILETQIAKIVFDERKEKNPCALCAKMRKGAINEWAKKNNINKIAFGHHLDDSIATLLMSMFYEGRVSTFKPVTYLDRMDITLIRPFIYVLEDSIIDSVKDLKLPVTKSPCPVDKRTKREYANDLVKKFSGEIPHFRKRMLSALQNKEQLQLWF